MTKESVHSFGEINNLVGILSEPENIKIEDLCIVLLNSGLLHRVGPYRMHVDLAREIAEMGVSTFRFDLSGIGDSQRGGGYESDEERAVLDIRKAFDYLSKSKKYSRFVTIGLCSGADNAHAVALVDYRLIGSVMLDGPGYPNMHYVINRYGPKIFKIEPWINLFKKMKTTYMNRKYHQEIYTRQFEPKEHVEKDILSMTNRGVELLYIYSGGSGYYSHFSQFIENFPSLTVNKHGSTIELEYYKQAEHTYQNLHNRKIMFKRIMKWINNKFFNNKPIKSS